MSQIKGKPEWTYEKCCLAMFPCCMCTFAYTYFELAKLYKVEHSNMDAAKKFCLPVLSYYQLIDMVMSKEGLHMVYINVVPDGPISAPDGAPVVAEEMER